VTFDPATGFPQYGWASSPSPWTLPTPDGGTSGPLTFLGRHLYDVERGELYACWFTDNRPWGGHSCAAPVSDIGRVLARYTWGGTGNIPAADWYQTEVPYVLGDGDPCPGPLYAARSMSVAGNYVFVRMGTDSTGRYNEIRVYKRSDGTLKDVISLNQFNYYASAQNNDVADVSESTQVRWTGYPTNEYRIFTEGLSQLETHLIRYIPDEP
jgi:hypothetical protein